MSATDSTADFEPVTDESGAPNDYQILSAYTLTPEDVTTTPPATVELWMSPEFTNPEGAAAERGKTRHYVIVIDYPTGVDNTVVRMNDCSTIHGSRLFRGFVEKIADGKGYTTERIDVCDYLDD